ncbi:hypothetical protein HNR15_003498 [Allobranchiibius huperziae]|uniref:Uncharacterized protein n=1 Tax=Allobranchiibius huperziae TaxID=1874116 RepID=A0A853DPH8_9MICO|nr:hypothetical protein [Allobranchiibius huperziae]
MTVPATAGLIGSGTGGVPHGPQVLLNEAWPTRPRTIRPAPHPIRVQVRLAWDDGSEWVAGRAERWTQRERRVYVALWHRRVAPVQGVWVNAADVRRNLSVASDGEGSPTPT